MVAKMAIPKKEKRAAIAAALRIPEHILQHELVGLGVRMLDRTNHNFIGDSGTVVDESRNTLTVDIEGQLKNYVKDQSTFSFRVPAGQWVRVDGKLLVGRPEDRIKKRHINW